MNKDRILVAVYGSLKKGFGNHRLLSDSVFVGTGTTLGFEWDMISFGAYPALIPNDYGSKVLVEVYEVTPEVFSRLDSLEGYPSFYDRKIVGVMLDSNYEDKCLVRCWIYYLGESYSLNRNLVKIEPDLNRRLTWTR